jgi:hypothetical protein
MDFDRLLFSGHAFRRMAERGISPAEVEEVVRRGEVIETQADSDLMMGKVRGKPLHVVATLEEKTRTCIVITVYYPDPDIWDRSFRVRKIR